MKPPEGQKKYTIEDFFHTEFDSEAVEARIKQGKHTPFEALLWQIFNANPSIMRLLAAKYFDIDDDGTGNKVRVILQVGEAKRIVDQYEAELLKEIDKEPLHDKGAS